jgi:hypothetical protein
VRPPGGVFTCSPTTTIHDALHSRIASSRSQCHARASNCCIAAPAREIRSDIEPGPCRAAHDERPRQQPRRQPAARKTHSARFERRREPFRGVNRDEVRSPHARAFDRSVSATRPPAKDTSDVHDHHITSFRTTAALGDAGRHGSPVRAACAPACDSGSLLRLSSQRSGWRGYRNSSGARVPVQVQVGV